MTRDFYKKRKLINILEQEKYTRIQKSIYQLTKFLTQKLIMLQQMIQENQL